MLFTAMHMPDPASLMQKTARYRGSKCSSDMVASIIEGFADRNMYLRMRQCDYDSKFVQMYKNLTRQELLFPSKDPRSCCKTLRNTGACCKAWTGPQPGRPLPTCST